MFYSTSRYVTPDLVPRPNVRLLEDAYKEGHVGLRAVPDSPAPRCVTVQVWNTTTPRRVMPAGDATHANGLRDASEKHTALERAMSQNTDHSGVLIGVDSHGFT